jgi:hypothetical protein
MTFSRHLTVARAVARRKPGLRHLTAGVFGFAPAVAEGKMKCTP